MSVSEGWEHKLTRLFAAQIQAHMAKPPPPLWSLLRTPQILQTTLLQPRLCNQTALSGPACHSHLPQLQMVLTYHRKPDRSFLVLIAKQTYLHMVRFEPGRCRSSVVCVIQCTCHEFVGSCRVQDAAFRMGLQLLLSSEHFW